eukprot:CAMPEP_0184683682 /NCGR_PEP_ID=MMETSP0312-20130426/12133_1 /TAXON_ID=31354 /ORGANISM="Compsopogon coeruleus, Strain SAG 36.94" /LENGTH=234 /DNA_ID=CAMNT_0027136183 /DNA_START=207 /DNA_END=911 /DNA_ORIENTATION=-
MDGSKVSSATGRNSIDAHDVLEFWFGAKDGWCSDQYNFQERMGLWFSNKYDAEIIEKFGGLLARAESGLLDHWVGPNEDPQPAVALLITFDQFSRVVHRGKPEMFANDDKACAIARDLVTSERIFNLPVPLSAFASMPFQHSETLADQDVGVQVYSRLVDEFAGKPIASDLILFRESAIRHRTDVARFGRFPHRNHILGRTTTPEEQDFLENSPRPEHSSVLPVSQPHSSSGSG